MLALALLSACNKQAGDDKGADNPASSASASLPAIVDPITVDVVTSADALAASFNQATDTQHDTNGAKASSTGTERSECSPYGRKSSGTSKTDVTWSRKSPSWVALNLSAVADANGGHYRTCSFCAANECVGVHGNDTVGRSNASAEGTVTVSFDTQTERPPDYQLLLSPSASATGLEALVSGPGMAPTKYDFTQKKPLILVGKQGAIYQIKMALQASARDEGGCCSASSKLASVVDVRVTRAPILAAGALTGYIVGGKPTTGYRNVGALRLGGEAHCSGTLIGQRTVLTAAHCVAGYEDRLRQMDFVLGSNINYPDGGSPFAIERWDYPKGVPAGFVYDPQHYDDDVAVVYLKTPVNVPVAKLYQGAPDWMSVRDTPIDLQFVGFGFNKIDGGTVGLGLKREAAWRIGEFSNRTVSFSVPGKNTCHGDSGGPAFIESDGRLLLAGVTSKGDEACSRGVEMRIDAYQPWLKGKIL
jgi:secreted trypsin-like serine protease